MPVLAKRKDNTQETTPAQAALDRLAAYIELHEITTTEALEVIKLYRDLCYAVFECPNNQGIAVLKSGNRTARQSKTNANHVVII